MQARIRSITICLNSPRKKHIHSWCSFKGRDHIPFFSVSADGSVRSNYGHLTWAYQAREKARFLIIEKPGVSYLESDFSNEDFHERFSLESWTERIIKVIRQVNVHGLIGNEIVLVGHSEGGVIAAKVAAELQPEVTHVVVIAGEGPSQLYSLKRLSEEGNLFYPEAPDAISRVDSLMSAWTEIQADSESTKRKFWGFTFKRWFSFLTTSVIDQLNQFNGKILIVQGNVHPESAEILHLSLLSKGKDVQIKRIPGADHSFNLPDATVNGWQLVADLVLEWLIED